MKTLGLFVMALLLFVVAFAGLSPPTQKQSKQNAIAPTSYVQPVVAAEVRGVTAPVSNNKEKLAHNGNDVVGANPIDGKNEVAARARNGSYRQSDGLNNYLSSTRAASGVGSVLLL